MWALVICDGVAMADNEGVGGTDDGGPCGAGEAGTGDGEGEIE